ncbi:lipopolysaccharide assembly protein LapA domain-containing protein [Pediococcus inopinatus]|uniref:LapA family protein n=1 Tax=Pediococcus inopinatus TaxID=114090 RepID=UPI002B2598B9|nr:lipopolysaccharide assembly protein LapA domain-containing protein [Pediococcus inopinatus]WPC17777.1 lipopolysaccharide assembly protein LapA domain-containing protein [Pediococcus inopinatus]
MKNQWRVIIILILVLLVAAFAVVNVSEVPISLLFTTVHWPLVLVILVSLVAGALITFLVSMGTIMTQKREHCNEIDVATKEIDELREENAALKRRVNNVSSENGQQNQKIEEL